MNSDEQFVRLHWENPVVLDSGWAGGRKGFGILLRFGLCIAVYDTEAEAWSAAATFTRERLEQIRQVEEEIEEIREDCRFWADVYPDPRLVAVYKRIFAREQAALDELRRGMTKQD